MVGHAFNSSTRVGRGRRTAVGPAYSTKPVKDNQSYIEKPCLETPKTNKKLPKITVYILDMAAHACNSGWRQEDHELKASVGFMKPELKKI